MSTNHRGEIGATEKGLRCWIDLVALNKIVGILVGVSAPNSANAGSIAKNSNPALTMANIATVDVRHRSFCCSFVLGITIKPG